MAQLNVLLKRNHILHGHVVQVPGQPETSWAHAWVPVVWPAGGLEGGDCGLIRLHGGAPLFLARVHKYELRKRFKDRKTSNVILLSNISVQLAYCS